MPCRDGELSNPIRFHEDLVLSNLNGERVERYFRGTANGPPIQVELTTMTRTNKEISGRNPLEDATKMRTLERIRLYLTMAVYNDTRDVPVRKGLRTLRRKIPGGGHRNPAFNL